MRINDFKEGEKVKYVGNNDYQKGVHTILEVNDNVVFLNNFYQNAKYFIVDYNNLNCLEKLDN